MNPLTLLHVIQGLYDSEINCSLETFWDGGLTVRLGDEMNGFRAEATFCRGAFDGAAAWLHMEAMHHYPRSAYALDGRNRC